MSVTTTTPVNPAQLSAALGGLAFVIDGDPTAAGASVRSEQVSDAQISQALAGITYDASVGNPQAALSALQALLPQLPAALAQGQQDAANFASMTAANQAAALTRLINNTMALAQGVSHLLGYLNIPAS